jgi:hypothetical protein
MLALFISVAVVAVERFINKRRVKLHEILRDVGWLTLVFAFIEFAYLFVVESGTLAFGTAMRPFWYTEWPAFKDLLFEAAVAVFLILSSVWLEQAGITELRISLRQHIPHLLSPTVKPKATAAPSVSASKCDVEW